MSVDLTGVRAAARESGIPRGTLICRMQAGKKLHEAVAMGRRTQREAHPKSAARLAREAAGVARTTARRREVQDLPPEIVLTPGRVGGTFARAMARREFIAAAGAVAISVDLARALPLAAAAQLGRWAMLSLSARVLWVLRGSPQRVADLVWLLDYDHRSMRNVLSGLRTRGLVQQIGTVKKARGSCGPMLVPLWQVTEKGART